MPRPSPWANPERACGPLEITPSRPTPILTPPATPPCGKITRQAAGAFPLTVTVHKPTGQTGIRIDNQGMRKITARRTLRRLRLLLAPLLAVFTTELATAQASVKLAWNPNPESDVTGYRLLLGTSASSLGETRSLGKVTTTEVSGLAYSTTYFAALQAVNSSGLVSPVSTQISFTTPAAPSPEIVVSDSRGTEVTGDETPFSWGSVSIGQSSAPIGFGISNTGTADLSGLAFEVSGLHAGDFRVVPAAASTLAPGSSGSFTVVFTPSAEGIRNATLAISSNDADENPFLIPLQGIGTVASITPVPAISVSVAGGATLGHGSAAFAFGSLDVLATPMAQEFTITSSGNARLESLSASLIGVHAADFSVSSPLPATLGSGASTSLTVSFKPNAAGLRTALLRIVSNDPARSPFDINLSGIGLTAPEIALELASGNTLTDGVSSVTFGSSSLGASGVSQGFFIRSTGSAGLGGLSLSLAGSHPGDFTVSSIPATLAAGSNTSFTVTFNPLAAGARSAILRVASNDADENPFDITLTGTGVAVPEIHMELATGTVLTDGLSSVAFGSPNLGSSGVSQGFVIRSIGSAGLSGLSLSLAGSHPGDFTVSSIPATLAAGSTASFGVTFNPLAAGARSAILRVASNDADENPFDITLTGTGVAVPEIHMELANGTALADGVSGVAFGSTNLGASGLFQGFIIRSTGSASLGGLALSLAGSHPGDFTVSSIPASIAAGSNASFLVTFKPLATGARSAILRVASNDADENPFDITLSGTGVGVPEIAVAGPTGADLKSGASVIAFNHQDLVSPGETLAFTIHNHGSAALAGIKLTLTGGQAADFGIKTPPASFIAPGASAAFAVTFRPNAAGSRSAVLHIASNDADENPFVIALAGNATATPDIGITLEDGITDAVAAGPLHFGSIDLGSHTSEKQLILENAGTGPLEKLALRLSGVHAADFTVEDPGSTSLTPGGRLPVAIRFKPLAGGLRTAVLTIDSNDPDETSIQIPLSGTALTYPEIAILDSQAGILADGASTLDFGNTAVGNPGASRVFIIRNTGNGVLTRLRAVVEGSAAREFRIISAVPASLVPGNSTMFRVEFTPLDTGRRTAVLRIASNDADEGSFAITLAGGGIPVPRIEVRASGQGGLKDGDSVLTFGAAARSSRRTITIVNRGTASLTGITPRLTGPHASEFRISGNVSGTLAPGKSTTFRIEFNPKGAGIRWGALRIGSNDSASGVFDVTLSGRNGASSAKRKSAAKESLVDRNNQPKASASTINIGGKRYRCLTILKAKYPGIALSDIQVSGNLVDWKSGHRHVIVVADNTSILKVRDTVPLEPGVKRHIRLKPRH